MKQAVVLLSSLSLIALLASARPTAPAEAALVALATTTTPATATATSTASALTFAVADQASSADSAPAAAAKKKKNEEKNEEKEKNVEGHAATEESKYAIGLKHETPVAPARASSLSSAATTPAGDGKSATATAAHQLAIDVQRLPSDAVLARKIASEKLSYDGLRKTLKTAADQNPNSPSRRQMVSTLRATHVRYIHLRLVEYAIAWQRGSTAYRTWLMVDRRTPGIDNSSEILQGLTMQYEASKSKNQAIMFQSEWNLLIAMRENDAAFPDKVAHVDPLSMSFAVYNSPASLQPSSSITDPSGIDLLSGSINSLSASTTFSVTPEMSPDDLLAKQTRIVRTLRRAERDIYRNRLQYDAMERLLLVEHDVEPSGSEGDEKHEWSSSDDEEEMRTGKGKKVRKGREWRRRPVMGLEERLERYIAMSALQTGSEIEDQVLASLEKYVLAYEAATNRKISL